MATKAMWEEGDIAGQSASCCRLARSSRWLLQAAELVFRPAFLSPDVFTEESEGTRRPLILAALAKAIDTEERLLREVAMRQDAQPDQTPQVDEADKQDWTEAFDLVRLLLARGASLRIPSETGVLPLEYAIKRHSLWVRQQCSVFVCFPLNMKWRTIHFDVMGLPSHNNSSHATLLSENKNYTLTGRRAEASESATRL